MVIAEHYIMMVIRPRGQQLFYIAAITTSLFSVVCYLNKRRGYINLRFSPPRWRVSGSWGPSLCLLAIGKCITPTNLLIVIPPPWAPAFSLPRSWSCVCRSTVWIYLYLYPPPERYSSHIMWASPVMLSCEVSMWWRTSLGMPLSAIFSQMSIHTEFLGLIEVEVQYQGVPPQVIWLRLGCVSHCTPPSDHLRSLCFNIPSTYSLWPEEQTDCSPVNLHPAA